MPVENQKKNLQCGSCANLLRNKVFDAKCFDLGRIPSSRSCSSHHPDAFALVTSEEKVTNLLDIAHLMSRMSPNDLQILAGLMLREKVTRKAGFKFLQKVYVRVQGNGNATYMNDFAVGYVLDATKDLVRITGENGNLVVTAMNDPNSLTLMTTERFAEVRAHMVRNKLFTNPQSINNIPQSAFRDDAVMPLDKVDDKFLQRKTNGSSVKRAPKDDLVSLIGKLGKGLIRPRKSSQGHDGSSEIRISHDS